MPSFQTLPAFHGDGFRDIAHTVNGLFIKIVSVEKMPSAEWPPFDASFLPAPYMSSEQRLKCGEARDESARYISLMYAAAACR